jgi:hypothetical protein
MNVRRGISLALGAGVSSTVGPILIVGAAIGWGIDTWQ